MLQKRFLDTGMLRHRERLIGMAVAAVDEGRREIEKLNRKNNELMNRLQSEPHVVLAEWIGAQRSVLSANPTIASTLKHLHKVAAAAATGNTITTASSATVMSESASQELILHRKLSAAFEAYRTQVLARCFDCVFKEHERAFPGTFDRYINSVTFATAFTDSRTREQLNTMQPELYIITGCARVMRGLHVPTSAIAPLRRVQQQQQTGELTAAQDDSMQLQAQEQRKRAQMAEMPKLLTAVEERLVNMGALSSVGEHLGARGVCVQYDARAQSDLERCVEIDHTITSVRDEYIHFHANVRNLSALLNLGGSLPARVLTLGKSFLREWQTFLQQAQPTASDIHKRVAAQKQETRQLILQHCEQPEANSLATARDQFIRQQEKRFERILVEALAQKTVESAVLALQQQLDHMRDCVLLNDRMRSDLLERRVAADSLLSAVQQADRYATITRTDEDDGNDNDDQAPTAKLEAVWLETLEKGAQVDAAFYIDSLLSSESFVNARVDALKSCVQQQLQCEQLTPGLCKISHAMERLAERLRADATVRIRAKLEPLHVHLDEVTLQLNSVLQRLAAHTERLQLQMLSQSLGRQRSLYTQLDAQIKQVMSVPLQPATVVQLRKYGNELLTQFKSIEPAHGGGDDNQPKQQQQQQQQQQRNSHASTLLDVRNGIQRARELLSGNLHLREYLTTVMTFVQITTTYAHVLE